MKLVSVEQRKKLIDLSVGSGFREKFSKNVLSQKAISDKQAALLNRIHAQMLRSLTYTDEPDISNQEISSFHLHI